MIFIPVRQTERSGDMISSRPKKVPIYHTGVYHLSTSPAAVQI